MTAQPLPEPIETRHDATKADTRSIIDMAQRLIRIPTRGGRDDYQPAVDVVSEELIKHVRQRVQVLGTWDEPLGVAVTIPGTDPGGPHYILNAPLDTADIGDPHAWTECDPFWGGVEDGWLYGRGAADSKVAVSIFTHLAGRLIQERLRGTLTLLFDLDEHTGGFGGIKTWLATQDVPPDGVMIGYPGPEKIVIGGRGVWRARITVHGRSAHSGSQSGTGVSAIARAAELIDVLERRLPGPMRSVDAEFGLPPNHTVTAISGGAPGSYSVVPDRCEIELDVRLTPMFNAAYMAGQVTAAVKVLDDRSPTIRPTRVTPLGESWPAYRLPADHELVEAIRHGARQAGLDPKPTVAGPSNIGCMLSQHGIPATAGFGVAYRGLHAANEAIDVATIPAVYVAYYEAARRLLG